MKVEINTVNVLLLILGISVFTYIPRSLPMVYLSGKELPKWLTEWMKFIPAGIFAALICPGIFTDNGRLNLSFSNIELMASIIVLLISLKKKSLGLSIVVGVVTITILMTII
nr:AzlD domain-containing protein [Clostridium paraputrificum]